MDYTIFTILTLNFLLILGLNRTSEYGLDVDRKPIDKDMLWFIRWYSVKWLGKWWSKPICTCVVCMSSLHSVYIFWFAYDFTLHNLYLYTIYVLALAGIGALYERISD